MTTNAGLTEALFQRGALMDLYIGRWTGMKKMRPNDMLLADFNEDAMYLGHKKLLPKKAMEPLIELEGKGRSILAARSMEFPIARARFVTYSTLPDVTERLGQVRKQWGEAVDVLATQYPSLMEQQLELLEHQADAFVTEEMKKATANRAQRIGELAIWKENQVKLNRSFYPTVEELKNRFSFTWRMFTISALEGVHQLLDPNEVQEAQNRLRADLQQWVVAASAEMHKTLGEAAANARQLLEKNGKLTPRNLKPLFDAFESFKAMDFTGKSGFLDTIQHIQERFLRKNPDGTYNLNQMAEDMNSDYSRQEIGRMLTSMGELAVDEAAEQAGIVSLRAGEFMRFVDLS